VSALLHLPDYLEQPGVSPAPSRSTQGWSETERVASRKPPRPTVSPAQGYFQEDKREVPPNHVAIGLDDAYVLERRAAVIDFIEENHLKNLLLQARDPLNAAFGGKAVKTLSLIRDDEGFDTLFCLVITTGSVQEARRALKEFDQSWWLARADQANGRLNFDFELV
jgi:hypothetical protein